MNDAILTGRIEGRIFLIRGRQVMLDRDLAELYGVETKKLNQAVRRNIRRFPEDFMFRLTEKETAASRFQFGTLKRGQNLKYLPCAFTENGVSMLSSVLRSERAIQVNIQIMRTFVRLKRVLAAHADFARKLEELEERYDGQFAVVFKAIRELMNPPEPARKRIGFRPD